jgi:hypothetical protein
MTDLPSWVRIGAKCTPVNETDGIWSDDDKGFFCGPRNGDICTITDIEYAVGEWWISVAGYGNDGFLLVGFRPIISKPSEKTLERDRQLFNSLLDPDLAQLAIDDYESTHDNEDA